jgi:hypothetical protein
MGGRVSGEEALVYYPAAELFETSLRWTSVLEDSSHRFFTDIHELAGIG